MNPMNRSNELWYATSELARYVHLQDATPSTQYKIASAATSLVGGLEMNTLFRVGNEMQETTRSLFNLEVEPPSSVDSCLPYPLFGIHNLAPQRGMARIFREEMKHLLRSFLDSRRGLLVAPLELVRADESHPG